MGLHTLNMVLEAMREAEEKKESFEKALPVYNPLGKLPQKILDQSGVIWRKGGEEYSGKLRLFFEDHKNQSGVWYVDCGWGGPPGALAFQWVNNKWINRGFGWKG